MHSDFGAARAAPFFSILLLAACAADGTAPPLPDLKIDPARVAVAGLSSGAYMATQAHLAFSDRIHGAALLAGGPYGCAGGDLQVALSSCMQGEPGFDADALLRRVRERADAGALASLIGLDGDRVLVLHGTRDATVAPVLGRAAAAAYRRLSGRVEVTLDDERDFAHTWPTQSSGSDCAVSEPPFLGRCGFDAAGRIFEVLFAAPGEAPAEPGGELRRFDQDAYAEPGFATRMADEGFLYLPPVCLAGETCGLLLAFHGCKQDVASVGEAFVRGSGLNRWADSARVVVLYPQASASYLPLNPNACWDWWGYTGADYDTRAGAQLRWVGNVLRDLLPE